MNLDFIHKNLEEYTSWRHHLHRHPEISFQETETSAFIASKLDEFGMPYKKLGLGIVASLASTTAKHDKGLAQGLALRADMDALPITELNDFEHKSENAGVMHACGHDGHTTMLLAAAHYTANHKEEFSDKDLYFIFQPAEEMGGGASQMIKEGLFSDFPIEKVYGMHNWPGLAVGDFAIRSGPIMAAVDFFDLKLSGKGGHAAMPHLAEDAIVALANIITQVQSIPSRFIDPSAALVISFTAIEGGDSHNVIPGEINIKGTIRFFEEEVHNLAKSKMEEIISANCALHNLSYKFNSYTTTAATINHPQETQTSIQAAQPLAKGKLITDMHPSMGAEDFAYMLEAKPGSYMWLGNGDSASLHSPHYDFNDKALTYGIGYWLSLMLTN